MTIDIYQQYYSAAAVFNGIRRNAVSVTLSVTSGEGQVRYAATLTFFPHRDEEDYGITGDAFFEKELYAAAGRRSRKREAALLEKLRGAADELAESAGGRICWESPLREARYER